MKTKTLRNLGLKINSKTQINCGNWEQWAKRGTITSLCAFLTSVTAVQPLSQNLL